MFKKLALGNTNNGIFYFQFKIRLTDFKYAFIFIVPKSSICLQ